MSESEETENIGEGPDSYYFNRLLNDFLTLI